MALSAPAAQAAEVAFTSQCTNKLLPSLPIPPSETKVDIQVSPVKDKYTVGELITVTWKWGSYNNVPESSPLPSIPADSTKPVGQINLTGSQPGVFAVEGERKNAETLKGQPLIVTDMKATLTLTAAGTLSFAPKQYSTFTMIGTLDAETECLPQTTPGVSASITVEPGQTAQPVLTAPETEVNPEFPFPLTGSNFAPNAAPQLKLCDADGGNCTAGRFSANTLAIDGTGKLTGDATIAAGVPDGTYVVSVVDGVGEARDTVTVKKFAPPCCRTAELSPATGPVNTVVAVTGKNWTPNGSVNIAAMNAAGQLVGSTIQGFTDKFGNFTAQYPITSDATTQIRVREGISSTNRVFVPFTVVAGVQATQGATVTLAPGTLSMTQAGDGINFGSATLNGTEQTLNANLNQVTVIDARGGNLGWSLTGTMTDLAAANGVDKIPAGKVGWTPGCAALPGSLSQVTNGTPGQLGSAPATLCSQAADSKATGGKFTADAQLKLTTPQFAAAGAYTGTLTLTLS